jgi:hypothetical protein
MTQTKEEILKSCIVPPFTMPSSELLIYQAMDIYAEQSNRQKEDRIKELETELANAKQFIKELLD